MKETIMISALFFACGLLFGIAGMSCDRVMKLDKQCKAKGGIYSNEICIDKDAIIPLDGE